MRVVIDGCDLPGRTSWTREGELLSDVHVGVQVRRAPDQLVPGYTPNTPELMERIGWLAPGLASLVSG